MPVSRSTAQPPSHTEASGGQPGEARSVQPHSAAYNAHHTPGRGLIAEPPRGSVRHHVCHESS